MSSINSVCGRMALACALAAIAPISAAWAQQAAPQPLTLAEALERARGASPAIGIANAQVDAARGRQRQAGAGLNPELSYDVENFGGEGNLRGMDSSESTLGVSQTIELGGKRSARREAAGKQADAVVIRARIARADLDLAVRERFAEVAAAEERVEVATARRDRATRLSGVAQTLVDAGREPPLRVLRAQAAAAEADAELNIATAQLSTARRALAALWGGGQEPLDATGPWELQQSGDQTNTPPDQTLDYQLAYAEHEAAEAVVRLERANRSVDVTVNAGVRRFESTGEQAFVAGVRVPIPIQNRNGGAIAAARADDRAAELQLSVAMTDAIRKLNDARAAFQAADARATALENQAIRQAEEALSLAQIGYEAGRFQLIDVLDAADALASIRNASIEARLARARAAAALVRANAN